MMISHACCSGSPEGGGGGASPRTVETGSRLPVICRASPLCRIVLAAAAAAFLLGWPAVRGARAAARAALAAAAAWNKRYPAERSISCSWWRRRRRGRLRRRRGRRRHGEGGYSFDRAPSSKQPTLFVAGANAGNGSVVITPIPISVIATPEGPLSRDHKDTDLPLNFHPKAIRASAGFKPCGAGGATCDRRSWSGLRRRSRVAERLAA